MSIALLRLGRVHTGLCLQRSNFGSCDLSLVLSREYGELFPIQPSYNVFPNSLLGTSKFLALRQSNFLRPASNHPDQNAVVGRSYFRFDLKGSGMPEREVGGMGSTHAFMLTWVLHVMVARGAITLYGLSSPLGLQS